MIDTETAPGWRVDESVRAETIAAHDLEALGQDRALSRITDFAAALCGAPIALVTLVEETEQRFLASSGTDLDGTPRDTSFCQFAMVEDDITIVPDATQDPRFANFAAVTGGLGVRFYAGAPIKAWDGTPLGALCVLDVVPREGLTSLQHQGLAVLAEAVMQRFDRNRRLA